MQEQENHKDMRDSFGDYFRRRLETHPLEADESLLEAVEKRIKRKRLQQRTIWSALAVAAVLMGLLFLLPTQMDRPSVIEQKEPVVVVVPEEQTEEPLMFSKEEPLLAVAAPVSSPIIDKTEVIAEAQDDRLLSEEIVDTELPKVLKEEAAATPQESATAELPESQSASGYANQLFIPSRRTESSQKTSLQFHAGFGSSNLDKLNGANDFANAVDPSKQEDWFGNNGETEVPGIYEPSHIDHNLPLSFGVTVRTMFSSRLGIESGLVYTYLSSSVSGSRNLKGNTYQHYIGIPVNVVGLLWSNPKWDVYLSAGAMMEKGLRLVYSISSDNKTSDGSESIDGLQWSLNASVGVSYRLHRHWSIYFEPRFSHYFDNNQPASYRTENRSSFNLGAGLRYEF